MSYSMNDQGWITAMKDLPRYYRVIVPHAIVLPQNRVSSQKYRVVAVV